MESGGSKHQTLCADSLITVREQTVGSDQPNVTNI